MRDFTLETYKLLLETLKQNDYTAMTMQEYAAVQPLTGKVVVLRHDVDLHAERSLQTAKIEYELGLKATYYFRIVPQSNQPEIIKQIVQLGHEIGYHYEDMSICKGDTEKAIKHFEKQLAYFRQFYDVKTISMHGVPASKYDGKDLWKTYDYKKYGIICEPYFDIDYSKTFYLTDTGRRWDGWKVSVRDKILGFQDQWQQQGFVYHSTLDVIEAIKTDRLPHPLIITSHPQRWVSDFLPWTKELIVQNIKNIVKRIIVRKK
ncbi:MAG: hypothetical protein IKN91_04690 [Paludibacteraceae bacterium]|nr:hypothetical protein [Paludibacteraceae bacterium]